MVASHMPPTGDLACNPGMCPDWELNGQPFSLQAGAQSTEPHQPAQVNTLSTKGAGFLTDGEGMYKCAKGGRLE